MAYPLPKIFIRQDNYPCVCPTQLFYFEGITAETEVAAKRLANIGCDYLHEWKDKHPTKLTIDDSTESEEKK